jgi:hypothetical protein
LTLLWDASDGINNVSTGLNHKSFMPYFFLHASAVRVNSELDHLFLQPIGCLDWIVLYVYFSSHGTNGAIGDGPQGDGYTNAIHTFFATKK